MVWSAVLHWPGPLICIAVKFETCENTTCCVVMVFGLLLALSDGLFLMVCGSGGRVFSPAIFHQRVASGAGSCLQAQVTHTLSVADAEREVPHDLVDMTNVLTGWSDCCMPGLAPSP